MPLSWNATLASIAIFFSREKLTLNEIVFLQENDHLPEVLRVEDQQSAIIVKKSLSHSAKQQLPSCMRTEIIYSVAAPLR